MTVHRTSSISKRHDVLLISGIATASPTLGMPLLVSWLPYEALQRLPAMWKRARDAYCKQRYCAEKRGIGWLFIFRTWWLVWSKSGHWHARGRGLGKFQMARHGDAGDYAPDNVKIIPHEENVGERSYERHRAACKRRSRRKSWLAAVKAAANTPEGRKQRSEIGFRREAAKRAAREAVP
jgi:hypothetical protein